MKFFKTSLVMLLGLGLFLGALPAQADKATCIGQYYDFIINEAPYKADRDLGLAGSRARTFSDLWNLSDCQIADILKVYDEMEALSESFKSAASACADLTEYESEYKALMMELYFIRRVQPISISYLRESDVKDLEERQSETLSRLEQEMSSRFTEGDNPYISSNELSSLFDYFSRKYEDRVAQYRKCEEGVWAALAESVRDFSDTLKELEEFGKDIEPPNLEEHYSVEQTLVPNAGEQVTSLDDGGFFQSVQDSWEAYKARRAKQREKVEELDAIQIEQKYDLQAITLDEAFDILDSSRADFDIQRAHADRIARYEELYGSMGAQASTDLKNIVSSINDSVSQSNTALLPQILYGVSTVHELQCQ